MTDRRLTEGDARRNNPDRVFSDVRAAIEMGGPAERAAAADHFRTRADAAFRLYGLGAPMIQPYESLTDYRRRLCQNLAPYSDTLRTMDFSHIGREALPPFERMLTDDAVELFQKPTGPLRSCVRRDHSGRESTMWFGDEAAAWLPFTNGDMRGRIVTKKGVCQDGAVPITRYGTRFGV